MNVGVDVTPVKVLVGVSVLVLVGVEVGNPVLLGVLDCDNVGVGVLV